MRQSKLLLVDDDLDLVRALRPALEEAGFAVYNTVEGHEALRYLEMDTVDAIILDVGLPDLDGFTVCEQLRASGVKTPILFLTSRGGEEDRVTGFLLGADDYVVKPFSVREMVFRVKALVRRFEETAEQHRASLELRITIGELVVNPRERTAALAGKPLTLSALEFDILLFFAQNPGKVFSREQLMNHIWAINSSNFAASVTTQISRLRKKIEHDAAEPRYLRTVYGVGYRFVDPKTEGN